MKQPPPDEAAQTSASSSAAGEQIRVRTPIGRACGGAPTRYALDHVRALKAKDGVVLQATDGHQAICQIATGSVRNTRLLPPQVLPRRQNRSEVTIRRGREGWVSSEGRLAEADPEAAKRPYPPVAETLPPVAPRPAHETPAQVDQRTRKGGPANVHITLGLDVDLLKKTAEALGSTKLALLVPIPVRQDRQPLDQVCVDKPLGVCPVEGEEPADGLGVLMPVKVEGIPTRYEKLRRRFVEAEQAAANNGSGRKGKAKKTNG